MQLDGYDLKGAVQYHHGKFPPRNLDYQRLAASISDATAALGRYDGVLSSMQNSDLLLAPLANQEAVISSRMEGTVSTLDEVLEVGAAQDDDSESVTWSGRSEAIEVFSYAQALKHAQRQMSDGLPLSSRLIRDAHRRLLFMGRGADKQPGEFKSEQNYIADRARRTVQFVPISPNLLPTGLKEWEVYVNDEAIEPLTQTAIAHVEFEALHPFKDGNGRIGRMLITLGLWNRGRISMPNFYVSGAFERRRDAYIDLMRDVSEHGRWTDWAVFFMNSLEEQANLHIETAGRINELYEDMKTIFRETLNSKWSGLALDYCFNRPIFDNGMFKRRSGVPASVAAEFTRRLLTKGLIIELRPPSGRRAGVYRFEPLMELIRI